MKDKQCKNCDFYKKYKGEMVCLEPSINVGDELFPIEDNNSCENWRKRK